MSTRLIETKTVSHVTYSRSPLIFGLDLPESTAFNWPAGRDAASRAVIGTVLAWTGAMSLQKMLVLSLATDAFEVTLH